MKDTTKKVLAGVLLGSTLSMVGCGPNDPTVKSVKINDKDAVAYLVGDTFDASKYKLDVEMSDGTTKTITVTSDMLVADPDMSSSGEKTIKITYEGKEYEYKFTVSGYSKAEMLAKLNAFLEDYNNANANSISASFEASYDSKFMDKIDGGETQSPAPVTWTKEMNAIDPLLAHLYKSLVASLNGEMTQNDIVNSNELKAQLEFLTVLNKLKTGMMTFDYVDYLLTTVFPEDSTNFEMIANGLSAPLKLSPTGTTELTNLLKTEIRAILNSLKADATEPYDFAELVDKLVGVATTYCTDNVMAGVIDGAYEVATLDEDKKGHELSTFVSTLNLYGVQFFKVYETVQDPEFPENPEMKIEQEVVEAYAPSNALVEKIVTVIDCIEDLAIAERDKETLGEEDYDFARKAAFNIMTEAFNDIPTCADAHMEEGWHFGDLGQYVTMAAPYLSQAVTDYRDSETPLEFVVNSIKSYSLPEMLASMLVEKLNGSEELTTFDALEPLIPQLVYDVLDGLVAGEKPALNKDNYLPHLYELFSTEDADQTRYETEWTNTGFCSIISEGVHSIMYNTEADATDPANVAADKCKALIEYLEDCLRTTSYGEGQDAIVAKTISWSELQVVVHEFLEAYGNVLANADGNQGVEPAGEPVGEGSEEMGEIATVMADIKAQIIDPLVILTDPEKTWTEKINNVIELNKGMIAGAMAEMMVGFAGVETYIFDDGLGGYIENPKFEEACADAYVIAEGLVDKYIAGTLTVNEGFTGLFTIVDDYSAEEMKYMLKTMALGTMISMGPNEEVDYDQLFDFVKLPEGVEDIDYNEVVNKYWQYAKDFSMIDISKVDVKYETNAQTGEIDKEICEITFHFDYDILVLGLDATFKLKLEIDL